MERLGWVKMVLRDADTEVLFSSSRDLKLATEGLGVIVGVEEADGYGVLPADRIDRVLVSEALVD